jgi:hypothetical protein
VEPLHLHVEMARNVRRLLQVDQYRSRDATAVLVSRDATAVLVVDLVLEAGPEIHRDRADLDFDRDGLDPSRHEHGGCDEQM